MFFLNLQLGTGELLNYHFSLPAGQLEKGQDRLRKHSTGYCFKEVSAGRVTLSEKYKRYSQATDFPFPNEVSTHFNLK